MIWQSWRGCPQSVQRLQRCLGLHLAFEVASEKVYYVASVTIYQARDDASLQCSWLRSSKAKNSLKPAMCSHLFISLKKRRLKIPSWISFARKIERLDSIYSEMYGPARRYVPWPCCTPRSSQASGWRSSGYFFPLRCSWSERNISLPNQSCHFPEKRLLCCMWI